MRIHRLKTIKPYWWFVRSSKKKFELRKDDRGFQEGDILILEEWDHIEKIYTGRECKLIIKYILKDFPGLKKGYVILGL